MSLQQPEKAMFILDAYGGELFEGYTLGEVWNGFQCPYFTFESAQHIAKILSNNQVAFYDEVADQFIFAEEGYEDDLESFGKVQVPGLGELYPIGTRVWAWDKLNL